MSLSLKRTLCAGGAAMLAVTLAACGGSDSSSTATDNTGNGGPIATYGDCKVTSKKNSIKIKPVAGGTLTVETTLARPGLVERHDAASRSRAATSTAWPPTWPTWPA